MSFEKFAFHPFIKAGISSAGYTTPTPIQDRTIQPVLDGRDVLGLAQTGTGKTAAFVLPILQKLMRGPRGRARALILSPTRELAEQTNSVIKVLGRKTGTHSVSVYGGVSAGPQIKMLRGGAEIIVACPGRLLDLMGQRVVNLSSIDFLVIDEADMMFDMGFMPDIRRIVGALPVDRQNLLFSATMPGEIRSLTMEMLNNPVTVDIGASHPVETIQQTVYSVEQEAKFSTLMGLLSQTGSGQVLVFTRTKYRAQKLAMQLAQAGISATSLQGNLSQNQRQAAMKSFRSGRVQVMVATDIAARGIDVTQISHVINYDVPDTADAYTHRIGRTGRMERDGTAFTLATRADLPMIRSIERMIGRPLKHFKANGDEVAPPSHRGQPKPNYSRRPVPAQR
ncbi:MAG: DEAD/DEAH box helicase [Bellilinea sp.]